MPARSRRKPPSGALSLDSRRRPGSIFRCARPSPAIGPGLRPELSGTVRDPVEDVMGRGTLRGCIATGAVSSRTQVLHRFVAAEQIQQQAQRLAARPDSSGSRSRTSRASSCATAISSSWCARSARRNAGKPLCRVPSTSPPPRSRRSSSAMRKPSSVSRRIARRCRATSPSGGWYSKRQVEASAPRPMRPRSWCSCARPKRSACSITMTVAAGTSMPTSMTVVATKRSTPPSAKSAMARSLSALFMRPCTSPTRPGNSSARAR